MQEYRVSKVKASSLHLDDSLQVRDEWEMSRSQRNGSLVTLANVAMIAAAAGIATALCREIKVKAYRAPLLRQVYPCMSTCECAERAGDHFLEASSISSKSFVLLRRAQDHVHAHCLSNGTLRDNVSMTAKEVPCL